jgi:hypothetical protein
MITIKKISINELPNLVAMSYEGDFDLMHKYYHIKLGFQDMINTTLVYIYQMASMKKLSYYKVIYRKNAIGYFVTFDNNFLYSFAINKKYRKKEILTKWWNKVEKELGETFYCGLYECNERAIKFLEKNGMKVIDVDQESKTVTLANN